MKVVLALLICTTVLAAKPGAHKGSYTTRYDNIDLEEILSNERLYKKYFDCLANKGKCTPDGKELKDVLPDALATECKKCSHKQQQGTEKVLRHLIEKRPVDYSVLEKLYDPTGTYKRKYKAEAEKRGIKIH
ncbi:ejaculatory bulb-specific protein 3 [Halyomorpha halys]|uniref:ejaculatory bulb-specific protein 3 n=1 Tax=Halyomorpha halys TaxID=286706 RepID=UPI0006D51519|nr:ejaculatory bulb-specific protein 3 [Halyomorpha halys]